MQCFVQLIAVALALIAAAPAFGQQDRQRNDQDTQPNRQGQQGQREGQAPRAGQQAPAGNNRGIQGQNNTRPAQDAGDRAGRDAHGGQQPQAVSDREFVQMASAGDLAEINFGNLALRRASHPEVKNYAQKMVTDHTKSSQELAPIATAKGLPVAPAMDAKHRAAFEKMAQLEGEAFDRHYMQHMVMDHQKVVQLYQGAARGAQDDQLKAFAAKGLPIVQEHLRLAQDIHGKLGGRGDAVGQAGDHGGRPTTGQPAVRDREGAAQKPDVRDREGTDRKDRDRDRSGASRDRDREGAGQAENRDDREGNREGDAVDLNSQQDRKRD